MSATLPCKTSKNGLSDWANEPYSDVVADVVGDGDFGLDGDFGDVAMVETGPISANVSPIPEASVALPSSLLSSPTTNDVAAIAADNGDDDGGAVRRKGNSSIYSVY
jgi:hypothetical protein